MFCDCAVAYGTNVLGPSLTSDPPPPIVPTIPCSFIQLFRPLPTSLCLSACHPGVMPLSQSLGAFLTQKQFMFAQSFGSRIRGWIVNYSRSACAPQPTAPLSDLLLTHLHGNGAGICFLSCVSAASHPHAAPPPPLPPLLFILLPRSIQLKGSWRESHGQEVLRVHPTEWSDAVAVGLLCSAWKEGLEGKCVWFV